MQAVKNTQNALFLLVFLKRKNSIANVNDSYWLSMCLVYGNIHKLRITLIVFLQSRVSNVTQRNIKQLDIMIFKFC